MEKKRGFHYGYIIVVAALIQYLISGGIIYGASGVFVKPVTTSMNISQGQFMLYMTFINGTQAVTATFLAPKLLEKFSYHKLDAVAVIFATLGLIMMGLSQNVVMFYVAGAFMGFGTCFLTALAAGMLIPRWFKMHQGTVIATVLLGSRFGGIVFNPIVSALINSAPLFGMSDSWRSSYVAVGLILLVIGLPIALLILKDYPEDKGLRPVWEEQANELAGKQAGAVVKVSGVDSKIATRSGAFILFVLMVITWALATTMNNYLAAYASGTEAAQTASFDLIGLIGSASMVGALIGGFLIGGVNDRFGGQAGGLLAGSCGALGLVILLVGKSSPVLILLGAALFGIYFAISGVQVNAMVSTLFGMRDYDKIYRAAYQFQPWLGAISASMWGFVYDINKSYTLAFEIAAVLCVLTAVLGVLSVAMSKKLKNQWVTEEIAE